MKNRVLIILLVVCLVIIIVMGALMFKISLDKKEVVKQNTELQAEVDTLHEKVEETQIKLDTISNIINSNVSTETSNSENVSDKKSSDLSDSEKESLFKKAVKDQTAFIDTLINLKDFSNKEFTDKEIVRSLPDSSEKNIFKSINNDYDFKAEATVESVNASAQKVFGKTIDVNSLPNDDFIQVSNDKIIVSTNSGEGITKAELVSIDALNNNDYLITFKFGYDGGTLNTYKLTVNYKDENVIYKGLEK